MLKDFQMSSKAGLCSGIWVSAPYGADLVVMMEQGRMNPSSKELENCSRHHPSPGIIIHSSFLMANSPNFSGIGDAQAHFNDRMLRMGQKL